MRKISAFGRRKKREEEYAKIVRELQDFDAEIRDIAIKIYVAEDGEHCPELLSRITKILAIGAHVGANVARKSNSMKKMHAALRMVVQLSIDGNKWKYAFASIFNEAMQIAKAAFLSYPTVAATVFADADRLAMDVRLGRADMKAVAGAELYMDEPEIYNKREELTA